MRAPSTSGRSCISKRHAVSRGSVDQALQQGRWREHITRTRLALPAQAERFLDPFTGDIGQPPGPEHLRREPRVEPISPDRHLFHSCLLAHGWRGGQGSRSDA
jgi:hypothetical protein